MTILPVSLAGRAQAHAAHEHAPDSASSLTRTGAMMGHDAAPETATLPFAAVEVGPAATVQISPEARELAQGPPAPPTTETPPTRMREDDDDDASPDARDRDGITRHHPASG